MSREKRKEIHIFRTFVIKPARFMFYRVRCAAAAMAEDPFTACGTADDRRAGVLAGAACGDVPVP